MKKKYHNREEIVNRLSKAGAPSVSVLSEETGIPKATLYAWQSFSRRELKNKPLNQRQLPMTKRIKIRTPSVKFNLVSQSFGLQGKEIQDFCDKHEVTFEELLSWRDLALSGIETADRDGLGVSRKEQENEINQLRTDLRRKNDALAEAAALLVLQKKTSEILGGKR